MKYILDTHVIIWMLEGDENLSQKVQEIIKNPINDCSVSIISFQEIAIKQNIGKLEIKNSLSKIVKALKTERINIIQNEIFHLEELVKLKTIANHKDPFDRMIIATAISEKMLIISIDEKFRNYNDLVEVIW
jgi:PIN domain nuclease of toxin-antitoxin system